MATKNSPYVMDIPYNTQLEVADILDYNGWDKLAGSLGFSATRINNWSFQCGGSQGLMRPTLTVLTEWGHQNPLVSELIRHLTALKFTKAARILAPLAPDHAPERTGGSPQPETPSTMKPQQPSLQHHPSNEQIMVQQREYSLLQQQKQQQPAGQQCHTQQHRPQPCNPQNYQQQQAPPPNFPPPFLSNSEERIAGRGPEHQQQHSQRDQTSPQVRQVNRAQSFQEPNKQPNQKSTPMDAPPQPAVRSPSEHRAPRLSHQSSSGASINSVEDNRCQSFSLDAEHRGSPKIQNIVESLYESDVNSETSEKPDGRDTGKIEVEHSERGQTQGDGAEVVSDEANMFSIAKLKAATNNFSDDRVIGEGSFGKVYLGDNRGIKYAVKVVTPTTGKRHSDKSTQHHVREMLQLNRFRHQNIITLMGSDLAANPPCLVFEYMERGSLQKCLADRTEAIPWQCRYDIAIDVAAAIEYLHCIGDHPTIHADVKTANILLRANWEAKLSDFGLTQQATASTDASCGQFTHAPLSSETIQIKYATFEYMPIEVWDSNGHVSTKTDVYCFGVVLLELLTGQEPMTKGKHDKPLYLRERMRSQHGAGQAWGERDPRCPDWPQQHWMGLLTLALSCIADRKKDRPDIKKVAAELDRLRTEVQSSYGFSPKINSSAKLAKCISPVSQADNSPQVLQKVQNLKLNKRGGAPMSPPANGLAMDPFDTPAYPSLNTSVHTSPPLSPGVHVYHEDRPASHIISAQSNNNMSHSPNENNDNRPIVRTFSSGSKPVNVRARAGSLPQLLQQLHDIIKLHTQGREMKAKEHAHEILKEKDAMLSMCCGERDVSQLTSAIANVQAVADGRYIEMRLPSSKIEIGNPSSTNYVEPKTSEDIHVFRGKTSSESSSNPKLQRHSYRKKSSPDSSHDSTSQCTTSIEDNVFSSQDAGDNKQFEKIKKKKAKNMAGVF